MAKKKDEFERALEFAKTVGGLKKEAAIKKYLDSLPEPERHKLQLELKLLELRINELDNKTRDGWISFIKTLIGIALGGLLTYCLQKDPKVEVINQVPSQEIRITYDTIHAVIPKNPLPKKNGN